MPRNHLYRTPILLAAVFLPLSLAAGCSGCEDEETDDISTLSTSAPEPSASVDLTVDEEPDAGSDAADDADADAGKTTGKGKGWDPTGLAACCQALHQNAKLGGPNQPHYQSAAALCDGLRKSSQGRAALVQVRRALLNAKVPATCK